MLAYCFREPAQPLSEFVERLWQINDSPPHLRERIVPSGTFELVVNLREDEFRIYRGDCPTVGERRSGAIVSGAYSRPFAIDARQHACVVGIHFRPGGAYPFLGVEADELTDAHVDLEVLWGRAAADLRERLIRARSPHARFQVLETIFLSRLNQGPNRHYAVRSALDTFVHSGRGLTIREVCRQLGLCQRRFIRVFAREVGLPPKLFCRIRRFQQTLGCVRQATRLDWAQLAWERGYCDQAHLINEFRDFSQLSPTEYLRQQSAKVMENHLPVPAPVNFFQYRNSPTWEVALEPDAGSSRVVCERTKAVRTSGTSKLIVI